MGIKFTRDAEIERQARLMEERSKTKWELLVTQSIVEAVHFARDNGWEQNQVQVKSYRIADDLIEFHVEPYEYDCQCPNLLHYDDYFIRDGEDIAAF